jgi:hypothetical protein
MMSNFMIKLDPSDKCQILQYVEILSSSKDKGLQKIVYVDIL